MWRRANVVQGALERGERKWSSPLLLHKMTFFDSGRTMDFTALLAALRWAVKVRVIAFEPLLESARDLDALVDQSAA